MHHRHRRRVLRGEAVALAAALALAACTGGDSGHEQRDGQPSGPDLAGQVTLPTLPGGIELPTVEPSTVLVGADLAFGTPLPSAQEAAEGLAAGPEVSSVLARRVLSTGDGRRLANAFVLTLDGRELFDERALDAFRRGAIGAAGRGEVAALTLAGRTVLRASSDAVTAVGFEHGDLLTIVTGGDEADVTLVVTRQLEALARGEVGSVEPVTPLPITPAEAAFVEVPTVTFAPIPPPEEELDPPAVPTLVGATSAHGRYGVIAGERRTVVWVLTLDPGTYPSAEALDPALPPLVAGRAGGTAAEPIEVLDRVVLASTNPAGVRSARAFRHRGLVLLVEGDRPDQLDAVVTAWIAALQRL